MCRQRQDSGGGLRSHPPKSPSAALRTSRDGRRENLMVSWRNGRAPSGEGSRAPSRTARSLERGAGCLARPEHRPSCPSSPGEGRHPGSFSSAETAWVAESGRWARAHPKSKQSGVAMAPSEAVDLPPRDCQHGPGEGADDGCRARISASFSSSASRTAFVGAAIPGVA